MAKKAATDLTAKTLEECRKKGWPTMKTEYWLPSFASRKIVDEAKTWKVTKNPYGLEKAIETEARMGPGVRKDLFGFVDVFCITEDGFLALQVTSWNGTSSRVTKIKTECLEYSRPWLEAGGKIQVWGWCQGAKCLKDCKRHEPHKDGNNPRLWHYKVVDITLDTMPILRTPGGALSNEYPF